MKASKSPVPKTRQKIVESKQSSHYFLKDKQLSALINIFSSNIEAEIQKIEFIKEQNNPQRCLVHNNIISLYCEIDRKPLCANCMYNTQKHRNHRVAPINKVQNLLEKDMASFSSRINGTLTFLEQQTNLLKIKTMNLEKTYQDSLIKLKIFYEDFRKMMLVKQENQVFQLQELKQSLMNENRRIIKEISAIKSTISDKVRKLHHKKFDDALLTKRNILQVLSSSHKILKLYIPPLFPSQFRQSQPNFETFEQIYSIVDGQLNLKVSILGQQKKKSSLNKSRISETRSLVRNQKSESVKTMSNKERLSKSQKSVQQMRNKKIVKFDLK